MSTDQAVELALGVKPAEAFFFYGPPGSGKTTLIASMCEVEDACPVLLDDFDGKASTMANLQKYIGDGRLIIRGLKSKLIEDTLYNRALSRETFQRQGSKSSHVTIGPPKIQPKGYLEIMDNIDNIDKMVSEHGIKTYAADPITTAYEHMYRLISFITGHGTIEESAWNISLMNAEEFLTAIMRLPVRYVIVTAHDRRLYDEDDKGNSKLVGVAPEVAGAMRNKIIKFFSEAYHMEPGFVGGSTVYQMRTRLNSFAQARTSRVLNDIEPAEMRVILDPEYREEWYKEKE